MPHDVRAGAIVKGKVPDRKFIQCEEVQSFSSNLWFGSFPGARAGWQDARNSQSPIANRRYPDGSLSLMNVLRSSAAPYAPLSAGQSLLDGL